MYVDTNFINIVLLFWGLKKMTKKNLKGCRVYDLCLHVTGLPYNSLESLITISEVIVYCDMVGDETTVEIKPITKGFTENNYFKQENVNICLINEVKKNKLNQILSNRETDGFTVNIATLDGIPLYSENVFVNAEGGVEGRSHDLREFTNGSCLSLLIANLANCPQSKFLHDNKNTGQSKYNGPQTNTLKWKHSTGDGIQSSSPAICNAGTIYIGNVYSNLYALNPDGSIKWKYTTGNIIMSSPAIGSDGTIYFGSTDKNLYALNPDGTKKWKYTTENEVYSSPAIGSDGTIYIGIDDGNLYALNPDGTEKWNKTLGDWIGSSPAIGGDGTIYVGSGDGNLYALNPDGSIKWNYSTKREIYSSPAIGSDGTIYIGSYDGNLYAIADPKS